jgi:hypothetical protein
VPASAAAVSLEARTLQDSGAGNLFLRIGGTGITSGPLALPPGVSRIVCLDVEPAARRGGGLRAVDVEALTASGEPATAGQVWAVAAGLDRPCGG